MFREIKLYWKKSAVKVYNSALFRYLLALVFVVGGLMMMAAIVLSNGIDANNTAQLYGYDMYYRTEDQPIVSGLPSVEGLSNVVLIPENGEIDGLDTEQGYIKLIDLADIDPIPLCVTPDVVDDWYAIVEVWGGYVPLDGSLEMQGKDGRIWNPCIQGMYLGWDIDWTLLGSICDLMKTEDGQALLIDLGYCLEELRQMECCCCHKIWEARVNPSCDNWGCIESNQYPALEPGCFDDLFNVIPNECSPNEIYDKDIKLIINTKWEGCPDRKQKFWVISVPLNNFNPIDFMEFPQLKISILDLEI